MCSPLATHHQISRGQELLQLLKQPAGGSTSETTVDADGVDVKVIVKRTFIEVIDPEILPVRMNRSMSDSTLPRFSTDSAQPWKAISSEKLHDISDASTTISGKDLSDAENDIEEVPETFANAAGSDMNWCNNQCVYDDAMQQQMAYHYAESWWMMPMASDPDATVMWSATPEGCSYMQSDWANTASEGCEQTSTHDMTGEWRTTVMLRNMPNNYTREMLLEWLDDMGFERYYDFAYLPVDFKTQAGLGYSFINFVSTADALRCFECFEGFCDWKVPSEKVCTVTWGAPYQGIEAHIERYQNSPVMHPSIPDDWKPILLEHGVRIPFPPPTKPIKIPKVRQM